jgi:hypothetical protein
MEGVRSQSWGAETKGSTQWGKLKRIFVFPLKRISIFFKLVFFNFKLF